MPFHDDACDHKESEYVGSFTLMNGEGVEGVRDKYDVYYFNGGTLGDEVCIRHGDNGPDYYSPGNLSMMREVIKSYPGHAVYQMALIMVDAYTGQLRSR